MSAAVAELTTWPAEIAVHPAAELFPLMAGKDLAELVEDIRSNGLLDPIVQTVDGRILDGRNRYRACLAADIEPKFRSYDGEPWRFVIATNLHRRHLTDGQRAMIAAKFAERARGEYVRRANVSADTNALPPSRREAAQLLSVSEPQVGRARVVEKHGTDALKAAVEAGTVPVTTAARVAVQPAALQEEFVASVEAGGNPRTLAAPTAPSAQRSQRFYKSDRAVLRRAAVEELVRASKGWVIGLADTTALDVAITSDEAVRWMDDLADGIRSLRKLHNLLKERTA